MKPRSKSTASNRRLIITSGDPVGIGWEVCAKALNTLGPHASVQFLLFKPKQGARGPRLAGNFKQQTFNSLHEALHAPLGPSHLAVIESEAPPATWVEEAATACTRGEAQALITAPLSKSGMREAGYKELGHTELLARVSGTRDLLMGFVGEKFAVVLATGHLPLVEAIRSLNRDRLKRAINMANQLRRALPAVRARRPLALVGVNPHAGEGGLIGNEENIYADLLSKDVHGPLVPDAAFLPQNWNTYSVFISPYHDQGLIPFKLVHGFDGGVHLTLGLPFVRTSVDHGTAKDLYGKNKANAGSMMDAIRAAVRLTKER